MGALAQYRHRAFSRSSDRQLRAFAQAHRLVEQTAWKTMALESTKILELWKSLNRPNPHKFRQELKRRGIEARKQYVEAILRPAQGSVHMFAPPPRYMGHITSRDLDYKRQADTIVNAQTPSTYSGTRWTHVLVVHDVFLRYAWAELMTSAMQVEEASMIF